MAINLDIVNPNWLHEIQVEIEKSQYGPPGPPPRPGLTWKLETHRWIRPSGIKEEYFHVISSINDEERRRITSEMTDEAKLVLERYWDKPGVDSVVHKARWCVNVFSEALEYIDNKGPIKSFVYANDQGVPEVACIWAIYPDNEGGKALSVDWLAVNPKNLKESTSNNKAHGMGTAAMYKIFEEAVKHKVSRVFLLAIHNSGKFYTKLGFKVDPSGGFYEMPISDIKARLLEAGMLQKEDDLDELIAAENKYGCLVGQQDDLKKARGVPDHAGPPPGPPPNPGLSWNYSSHRWIRPMKGNTTKSGLRINPEWTDVWINDDPTADVQARGIDKNGMKRTLTSAAHKDKASVVIFARVKELTPSVPGLKNKFAVDSDHSEEASVMYVIARTGLRIGSDADTKAKVKAYGISTLKPEHVKVSGNKVSFDFIAKKGVHFTRTVIDQKMAEIFSSRLSTGGDIFDTNDKRVRKYFKSIKGMKDFDVKDFRTYNGTKSALREIARMPKPTDKMMYAKQRMEVARIVSAELGNTPATALKYYIAPEVFINWQFDLDNIIKKSSDESEQSMQDFVESIEYIEDIDWRNIPNPDPDDDDDSVAEIIKARKYKKPEDSKPPEDPPMDQKVGGQGGAASLDLAYKPLRINVPSPRGGSSVPPGPPPRPGLGWKPSTHRWTKLIEMDVIDTMTQFNRVGDGIKGDPKDKWVHGVDNSVKHGMVLLLTEPTKSPVWHRADNPIFVGTAVKNLAKEYPLEAQNLMLLLQTYVEAADPEGDISEKKLDRCLRIISDMYPLVMGWSLQRAEETTEDAESSDWGRRGEYLYRPSSDNKKIRPMEEAKQCRKKFEELEDLGPKIKAAQYGDKSSKIKILDTLVHTAHVFEPSLLPQFAGVGLMHGGVDFLLIGRTMTRYMEWLAEEVKCYDVYTSELLKAITLSDAVFKSFIPGRRFMPSKPRSKFYDETPDAKVVYDNWAEDKFDQGHKVLVEMRYPGVRAVASRDTGDVNIWFADDPKIKTKVLPDVVLELTRIPLDFIIDGQIMIYRDNKPTDKVRMNRLMNDSILLDPDERIVMALFDILFLKKDISELPLIERKRVLRKFFNDNLVDSDNFILADYSLVSDKTSFINAVKKVSILPGSCGSMSKDASSPYTQGLNDDWVGTKTDMTLKVKVLSKREVGASFVYSCGVLID